MKKIICQANYINEKQIVDKHIFFVHGVILKILLRLTWNRRFYKPPYTNTIQQFYYAPACPLAC